MAIKILNDLLPIAEQTEVGVVKPDNVSITITETGELQSSVVDLPEDVVTAENYDNPKLWKGTLEEYNAIETKDPLVTYIITDDNVETLKTTDYNALSNKPSINDITLEGNKTLEELNIQAADTSLTTSQITNCITKIPQDIKLELTDGTLILKAGSKVYVPNGFEEDGTTLKFDSINILQDYIFSFEGSSSNKVQVFLELNTSASQAISAWNTVTSQPSGDTYNRAWDITANRFWQRNASGEWTYMPIDRTAMIGIVTIENKIPISIDQIFNGFGFIGSTIFALPGVEGLIPNGRNTDGSLNNIKCKLNTILTRTSESWNTYIWSDGNNQVYVSNTRIYDFQKNYIYETNGKAILQFCLGYVKKDLSNILNLKPKYTFNAIDKNDTEWASTASKPSSRYIDLTLGASDSTYSAPANGWVWLRKHVTEIGQYVELAGNVADICYSGRNNTVAQVYIPVKKNEMFRASYTAAGATVSFRFIYDEGVK